MLMVRRRCSKSIADPRQAEHLTASHAGHGRESKRGVEPFVVCGVEEEFELLDGPGPHRRSRRPEPGCGRGVSDVQRRKPPAYSHPQRRPDHDMQVVNRLRGQTRAATAFGV